MVLELSFHIKRREFISHILTQISMNKDISLSCENISKESKSMNELIKRGTTKIHSNGDFIIFLKTLKEKNKNLQISQYELQELVQKEKDLVSQTEIGKEHSLRVFLNKENIFVSTLPCLDDLLVSKHLNQYELNLTVPDIHKSNSITQYRCHLTALHVKHLLGKCGATVHINGTSKNDPLTGNRIIIDGKVSEKFESKVQASHNLLLCAPVIEKSGGTKLRLNYQDYISLLADELKIASEQRTEIVEKKLFEDFIFNQAKGCCALQLMNVNHMSSVKLDVAESARNVKESVFVLYNHARICTLFRNLEELQERGIVPSSPPIQNVDFSLLRHPEEWNLFWVFVHRFPELLEDVSEEIISKLMDKDSGKRSLQNFPTHSICKFLHSLAHCLSVYYNRVHILPPFHEETNREALSHLLPSLWARIYLLKAVYSVMKCCLECLQIDAPSVM